MDNAVLMLGEFESYFRLLWLLVLFVSLLMVFLCYLYLVMRKAREKEMQSTAFSSFVLEGQEIERQRIAAELHDAVLPQLRDNPAAARIREICGRLMPPDFTRYCLKDSLASLCDSFVKTTGIDCIVEIADDISFVFLNPEQQLSLYRIVQETLNNIGKHSKAKQTVLVARYSNEPSKNITISISDDGVGLPEGFFNHNQMNKFGMSTMRQRAAILGASIDFISEEENGLMVCIKIPQGKTQ